MFSDQTIVGSWDGLVARLDARREMYRWVSFEPVLSGIESVADLPAVTARGTDAARADAVIGALVRISAADRPGGCDAVLVLVHLLSPGLVALARDLSNLTECALDVVVAEACCQIRAFPIQRRFRAFAANILLDTRKRLLRELLVIRTERPTDFQAVVPLSDCGDSCGEAEVRLADVLEWAIATRVVGAGDAEVLRLLAGAGGYGSAARESVAARLGCSVRTVGRRREAALASLRGAAPRFFQEVSAGR